jgi:hypothetical protein
MRQPTKNGLILTSIAVLASDWAKFKALATAQGTTAAAMVRGFMRRKLRKAAREAIQTTPVRRVKVGAK